MAVPFNMPDNQNEVEVIITQLQSLLTKLQAAVRRTGGQPTRTNQAARVRSPASSRLRSREEQPPSTSAISSTDIPDLLNNLAWLAAVSQDAASGSSSLTATSVSRSSRRRTSSESSNCEETKTSIRAAAGHHGQDWNQADNSPDSEPAQASSCDSILSKFVPGPVSAPLWTAMICFVGWHLFRAR